MAAPSPSTRPERVRENGRQVSALSTRKASQPLNVPTVRQASVPPVSADGAWAVWTIWNAWAMAWVPDAHAAATVKVGPLRPGSMEIKLHAALDIRRGI